MHFHRCFKEKADNTNYRLAVNNPQLYDSPVIAQPLQADKPSEACSFCDRGIRAIEVIRGLTLFFRHQA